MIVIDLVHHTSNNLSTVGVKDPQPRLRGGSQYVPNIGNSGLLVALGGKVFDGVQPVTSQSLGRLIDFGTVDVFDLASYSNTTSTGTWYTQSTSGEIPPAHIDSCTVLASAPDSSSHEIFMYGGWGSMATGHSTKHFDDLYALPLPSFTWIKMFEGDSPRYGHTCNLTADRQLLTIGRSTQHGNMTDTCDWEAESIAVMNLPTMTGDSVFAGYRPYKVSNGLIDKLGGTAQGNATLRSPPLGWASAEFENTMHTSRVYSNLGDTLEISGATAKKPSGISFRVRMLIIATVTIVGIGVIVCVLLLWLRCRRRNHNSANNNVGDLVRPSYEVEEKAKLELSPNEKPVYELTGEGYMHEATDGAVRVEADRSHIVIGVAELPATNFSESGRGGIPLHEVPSQSIIDGMIAREIRCSKDAVSIIQLSVTKAWTMSNDFEVA